MPTAWKDTERTLAKRLGGKRAGPTGRTGPDILHPLFAVEAKERKRPLPREIRDALSQAVGGAKAGQLPLVIWHTLGERHDADIVMLRLCDFEQWMGEVGR